MITQLSQNQLMWHNKKQNGEGVSPRIRKNNFQSRGA